jgi:hypothetical protein
VFKAGISTVAGDELIALPCAMLMVKEQIVMCPAKALNNQVPKIT